ncbi:uncharacterized protein LOC116342670 [Contarinia nasturtii]|uniref:uncharacterized protein LOC116342670 n=1 Tax=Contarinia nasturtii TaxID=265458 RepID=UPI0012D3CCBD|nr:uncharacterized protein LOC116342670 [Contarinia nasturtii]
MYFIKVIGIIIVAIAVVRALKLRPEDRDMFMMFSEECRKTHKPTEADMKKLMDGEILGTKPVKCTMTCVLKQFKLIKEEGGKQTLDVDNVMKLADMKGLSKGDLEKIREISEICKSPSITDECDFGAEVGKCASKESKERGIENNLF